MADLVGLLDEAPFVGETVLDFFPELEGVCVALVLVSVEEDSWFDSGIWLVYPRPRNGTTYCHRRRAL